MQYFSVFARCRGRCCRWSERERSLLHLFVSVRRRGMCLSCGALGKGGVRFQLVSVYPISGVMERSVCIKCLLPPVSAQTIPAGHRSFGLHKISVAAGIGANDSGRSWIVLLVQNACRRRYLSKRYPQVINSPELWSKPSYFAHFIAGLKKITLFYFYFTQKICPLFSLSKIVILLLFCIVKADFKNFQP